MIDMMKIEQILQLFVGKQWLDRSMIKTLFFKLCMAEW